MKTGANKNLKQLLHGMRKDRDHIWSVLRFRTKWLKAAAERDESLGFLTRLALEVEKYNAMESLFVSLICKRARSTKKATPKQDQLFSPYERTSLPLATVFFDGPGKFIFKLN